MFSGRGYWLVAHALAHGHTVVTHEVPSASAKKIKIPNVCVGLGISCMSPFEMLRLERAGTVPQLYKLIKKIKSGTRLYVFRELR